MPQRHRGCLLIPLLAVVLAAAAAPRPAAALRALRADAPPPGPPPGPAPAPTPAPAPSAPAAAPAAPAAVHFVFGYGSLLSRDSTARSNCQLSGLSEDNISGLEKLLALGGFNFSAIIDRCHVKGERAVRVKGLQRGWFAPVTNTKTAPSNPFPGSAFNQRWTALGAEEKPGAEVTGLVYEIDDQAFANTMEREKMGGYEVKFIPAGDIAVLHGKPLPPDAKVAAFVSPPNAAPPADGAAAAAAAAGAAAADATSSGAAAADATGTAAAAAAPNASGGGAAANATGGAPAPGTAAPAAAASRAPASADAPIPLSYIDVWIGGASELQNRMGLSGEAYRNASGGRYGSFVEETLKTTAGWAPFIVNDREQPLRPYETNYLGAIDDALYTFVDHSVLAAMRYPGSPPAPQR
ncbi:hypothetical protein Rsub_05653 [Raphidocelis subcapitata]|uniref:Gamma-glutamylcyclotransferase n=1 Tax=Raphidocelis subcapitata TaxID=307507 RepID=A0A2V0P2C2_9CHLO|nr:hypothetical protein Rsub_05653 [Raphidocelis subcapitata]|eukprot:GBF93042.1 hypothetical protein Rsub_05653 [Raphidocelis subcapitata]